MTAQQFKIFNQARAGATDLNNLGFPEATTSNGREVKMFAGGSTPFINAMNEITNLEAGMSVDVLPFYSTNTFTFDLDATASMSWLTGWSPQTPEDRSHLGLETKQAKAKLTLSSGQTAVLQIPTDQWISGSQDLPGPRTVLVFLTPKAVNSRAEPAASNTPNQ